MKSSEVLKAALERMDGGRKWCKGVLYSNESCCANGAIALFGGIKAQSFLRRTTGKFFISHWNDSASDFSVIEKGFQKAISLAIAEGD